MHEYVQESSSDRKRFRIIIWFKNSLPPLGLDELVVIELVVELVVVVVGDITFDVVDGITRGTPEIWREYVINVTCM